MKFKHKKILKIIGIVIACCVGVYIATLALRGATALSVVVSWNYIENQDNRGEASAEEKAEFEKYYDDFENLSNFVVDVYDKTKSAGNLSEDGWEYFFLDTKNGKIKHFSDNFNDDWLSIDSEIQNSIKRMAEYFGPNYDTIFVTNERVTFDCGEEMIVFMKDGTVPTYASEQFNPNNPDILEEDEEEVNLGEDEYEFKESYYFTKLRDNWYYIVLI